MVPTAEGQLTILDGVDVEINAGESVAVVGASGSGKTTLLGILAGLDLPSRGTVTLVGRELTALDEEQRARVRGEHVGFVFQTFQLLGSLTALENVMLPAELHGEPDAREQAEALLRKVGLGERMGHYPRQLSGGEQQRVAIARAFASRPNVLFADEPTGNLDTATGAHIIDLLFELNAEFATTLVLVTHDERLAERCQRVVEIDGGRIVAERAAPAGDLGPRPEVRRADGNDSATGLGEVRAAGRDGAAGGGSLE
jgi:putative ABC transport system ATP-binding protein